MQNYIRCVCILFVPPHMQNELNCSILHVSLNVMYVCKKDVDLHALSALVQRHKIIYANQVMAQTCPNKFHHNHSVAYVIGTVQQYTTLTLPFHKKFYLDKNKFMIIFKKIYENHGNMLNQHRWLNLIVQINE